MDSDERIVALEKAVAVQEERMSTMQADLSATLERFEANGERRNAEIHKQITTATERMATTRWWQTAVLLGGIVAAVVIAAIGWMLQLTL